MGDRPTYLPLALGFRNAYLLAVLLNVGIGTNALLLASNVLTGVAELGLHPISYYLMNVTVLA